MRFCKAEYWILAAVERCIGDSQVTALHSRAHLAPAWDDAHVPALAQGDPIGAQTPSSDLQENDAHMPEQSSRHLLEAQEPGKDSSTADCGMLIADGRICSLSKFHTGTHLGETSPG
jgi:hypothetical protein